MRTENEFPSALLLDSGGGWLGDGSGGCLAFGKPEFTLSSSSSGSVIFSGGKSREITGDPLEEIEKKTSGGYVAVGFIGYEYLTNSDDGRFVKANLREKTSKNPPPVVSFHFYPESSVTHSEKIGEEFFTRRLPRRTAEEFNFNSREKKFVENVWKIKTFIEKGDVYQVNLSEAWEFPPPEEPGGFFMDLFNSQPVPFAAYMDFGCFQFLSGSMELFLKKTGGKVVSRPIKGTVKRGESPDEDLIMKQSLASSEKEKAEILMITDLMRNDLSRICVPSSVKTKSVFNIKSYETLFHMESEVEGVLRENISVPEIIKKTFPPGSVTGAPKPKALEIIDSLEQHSRGPYCGAAGVFYPGGDFCLSVSIRCLQIFSSSAFCWSGAGIVWDSDPEKEFQETALKLKALRNAAGMTK